MSDEEATPEEVNYEEQYNILSEECKKLKIDISSLQLSNRSLVNQNRDEKKKVMDCRLQIADLEGRLKTFEATKQELSDCQNQCDRVRMSLESSDAKLEDAERRADEASGLIKIKDSIILKQSNFTKEIEERLNEAVEDRDRLLTNCDKLESDLNIALIRAEDADEMKVKLEKLEELFDKLANEKSEATTESGLAAANDYFKAEQIKSADKIQKLKEFQAKLEEQIEKHEQDKRDLLDQMDKQMEDYEQLSEKCATLEARIKEMARSERRYGGTMGGRLIGPTLPPWITDEKKIENDLERLSKADPATLRAKVMELESQVGELNQLLTYREDVILRIHEEIGKKASRLEAAEVERSSLNAQVSILKRELSTARDDLARRGAGPMELEAEIERLRGKRDREYQRRKRIESELDEIEKENQELKQRTKRLEENVANMPPPKPVVPQSDPTDRNRIIELQGTVNQLRMDNEAKRSELFDLRARFDTKSTQMDKISAELKTMERSTGELTSQLNSVRAELETTTKDLESVRCRAVRGGAEVERWHSDLTSLQVTNKFLSSQLNENREKMLIKERQLAELTKRCQELLSASPKHEPSLVNGDMKSEVCRCCGNKLDLEFSEVATLTNPEVVVVHKEISSNELDAETNDRVHQLETDLSKAEKQVKHFSSEIKCLSDSNSELEAKLKSVEQHYTDLLAESNLASKTTISEFESKVSSLQKRLSELSEDLEQERGANQTAESRVQSLITQVNELETSLAAARSQLLESKSAQRKAEIDALPIHTSPPVKRTRRGSTKTNAVANNQECSNCVEFRKQLQDLETSLSDYSSREQLLTEQINNSRLEIAESTTNATKLRAELSAMQQQLAK